MGLNAAARLKKAGIEVKKTDVIRAPLEAMHVVTSGPTRHPRAHLPVDAALVDHIKAHGIPTDERRFKSREDGDRLEVIDGARRTKAARVAETWLQKNQPRQPPLEWDRADPQDPGRLYVETEIVSCSDLDLMLERLGANVSRGLPDSASVLASIVASIIKINKGEPDAALLGRILAAMPQGVTAAVVTALARWDNLAPELQARFDSGDAPIGLLVPVLAARAEDREAVLARLIRDGVRTAKGATRQANKARNERDPWARRMSPRQAVKVADALTALELPVKVKSDRVKHVAEGIVMGLYLAANEDVESVLSEMPDALADAIREARATKPTRKAGAR
jgi:hypothetical protein